MKTKEEISKILDEILDKIKLYNENKNKFYFANSIILPNDLYFYFTSQEFLIKYVNDYGIFQISFRNNILYIFSIKCYRTLKLNEIYVECKYHN